MESKIFFFFSFPSELELKKRPENQPNEVINSGARAWNRPEKWTQQRQRTPLSVEEMEELGSRQSTIYEYQK